MFLTKGRAASAAAILLMAFANAWAQGAARPGVSREISTRLVVSNEHPLPFEPLEVRISLRNETAEPQRVVAAWHGSIEVAEVTGEKVVWHRYVAHNEPVASPPLPKEKLFAAGEVRDLYWRVDYEAPSGRHVFARPGRYRLRAAASYDTRFVSNEVEVVVREPGGSDARAYESLKSGNVHRYFGEGGVAKYPRTRRHALALEQFVKSFDGSEYADLARVGLALMWMKGVDGKTDEAKAADLLTRAARTAKDPSAARAYYHLGMLRLRQGDEARAREAFRAASKARPDGYYGFLAAQMLAPPQERVKPL